MLAAEQNKEKVFFMIFLERAINGDREYLNIIEPIILEAAKLKRGELSIYELDKKSLDIKLELQSFSELDKVSENDLMLKNLLIYVKEWDFYK